MRVRPGILHLSPFFTGARVQLLATPFPHRLPFLLQSFQASMDWLEYGKSFAIPVTIASAVGTITILHLTLVRTLRWRRYHDTHRKYEVKWKEGRLTPGEAQRIIQTSCVYDMPWLLIRALAFALFKTYTLVSRFLSSSPH